MTPAQYIEAFYEAHPRLHMLHMRNGGYGRCDVFTRAMVVQFPELERVPGIVKLVGELPPGDRREWTHWWCQMKDSTIVDPTEAQFHQVRRYKLIYEPMDMNNPITGKCMNCGGWCRGGRTMLCADRCEREYANFLNGEGA